MRAYGRHPRLEKPHLVLRRGVWLVHMCAEPLLNMHAVTWAMEANVLGRR